MTPTPPETNKLIIKNQFLLFLTEPENFRVEYLNNSVRSYFGIDSDELLSKEFGFYKEFLHPDDHSVYKKNLQEVISEEKENNSILRIKSKGGIWSSFKFRNRAYKGIDGKMLVLSIGEPMAELKENENPCTDYEVLYKEYENLINSLDEGFCMIDLIYDTNGKPQDYLYLRTNDGFEKHVNYQNVSGKTMLEVVKVPPRHLIEAYADVAETGESIRFLETNENIQNGWLDLFAFKLGDDESRRVGLLFRNITNRKLEEESLKNELLQNHRNLEESKKLLQSVFDTTNLAIAVMEVLYNEDGSIKDFKFKRTNKVLQEIYLKENIVDQSYRETSKYGVKMGIFDAFKQVMSTGVPFDQEFYFNKEGYDNWFRVTARKQSNLLITTLEDITSRKAKAKELEETIRFKRELVKATPEIIMIINLNSFSVRYINKDLVPEAGLTQETIQGKSLQDVIPYIHPRDRQKVIDLHKNLLKASEEKILDTEIRLKLKGTTWEWFNIRGKVFKRKNETWVDEYVLLVRNITEHKNTQKALLKAEKLSIQGELARTFAHELRNPLASIGLVSEVLDKKFKQEGQEDFRNYFNILKRSAKTLNELVSNLLNASNYTPAVLKSEDLGEIMNHTVHKASDRIYLSGIKVLKKYKGKFPILADKEKLGIALMNIIVNASEATTPGEGIIEIQIEEHKSDFMLSIKDNGKGMDQDQIDNLFEAFYTKKDAGIGIGMNSVKNILEEHDAQIEVFSKPNKGTTFRIFFHNEKLE